MVESEEKRKRLTDLVTHWCKHTKVLPQLRENDIPGLVGQILGEFYHATLCCGHLVQSFDEGVILEFYEFDDKTRGTVIGSYCRECVKKYKRELGAWEVKND